MPTLAPTTRQDCPHMYVCTFVFKINPKHLCVFFHHHSIPLFQAAQAEANLIKAFEQAKRAEAYLNSAGRFNQYSNVDGWVNVFHGDPTGGDFGGVQVHRQKQALQHVQHAAAFVQAAQAACPSLPPVYIPPVEMENKWRMVFLDTFGVNRRNMEKVQAAYAGVVQMLGDIDRNIRIVRGGGSVYPHGQYPHGQYPQQQPQYPQQYA